MFSGAQLSLYPMCDDFVAVILKAVDALEPYRPRFRIETDDDIDRTPPSRHEPKDGH